METTGMVVYLKDLADLVVQSQARSLVISMLLIALIAGLLYRSAALGVFAIIVLIRESVKPVFQPTNESS